jgi:catechol 2,3-dioxygenase-like lactoylglutathione lyase family enzyme
MDRYSAAMALTYLRTVPILRSFDEGKAREFYVDFLGFSVDWEHRFEPGTPLYMQLSRAGIVLHVSEHHGDGSPGVNVRIDVTGLRDFHAELIARRYKNMRPGLETPEWGGTEMTVIDGAGNRLIFVEADKGD